MSFKYWTIDADSHVYEQPDTWTSRMSKQKWGDRIPQIRDHDGKDYWFLDDKPANMAAGGCPAAMPDRSTVPTRYADMPKSVYMPKDRLDAMDIDGVTGVVLYPQISGASNGIFEGRVAEDPDFQDELVRAFNDYVAEEWMGYNSRRFFGICLLPYLSGIEGTVSEAKHSLDNGHWGVILGATPEMRGLHHYSDPYWAPLFSMLNEAKSTINFHSQRGMNAKMRLEELPDADPRRSSSAMVSGTQSFQAQHYANLLLSGIIGRYENLNWVVGESGVGWVPYLLEASDHAWETGKLWKHGVTERPYDTFRKHCYNDFWFERGAIQKYRDIVGVDRILWETDFPHPTSLWPETWDYTERSLEGVPANEQRMILAENAQRCYHIPGIFST